LDSRVVPLKEHFQELIAQALDGTAGLRLSMLGYTLYILGETMQGVSDFLPEFLGGLTYGGKRCLVLVLVFAGHSYELLAELVQLLFDLIPLTLVFQRQLKFQRFETLIDIVLGRIHRGSQPLWLSVGRK